MTAHRSLPVLALVALFVTGCGTGDTRAAGVAGAECNSAVHDQLGLSDADTSLNSEFTVTGDDDRRQVEGIWRHPELGHGAFSCVVVPDASDQLRGVRVAALAVANAP